MSKSGRAKSPARWALQDAKNKLSEVVDAAVRGQPQIVTRRGVETAVIIAHAEYERMTGAHARRLRSLSEYLLAMPSSEHKGTFGRIELRPRDAGV